MQYIPYVDSDKLRERIRNLHYLDPEKNTPGVISKIVGKPVTTVCFHLKALGISIRQRPRQGVTYCMVCGKNAIEPSLRLVCRDHQCTRLFVDTFTICQVRREEAEVYLLTQIPQGPRAIIPLETFALCTKDGVHRAYIDEVDHLKYHIYCWKKSIGERTIRQPTPLWIHEFEKKQHKERLKEADYIRRNEYSEHALPRRIR